MLFTAVRDAVARVYGASIPQGREFLDLARRQGVWLVDLASEPVNRLARELSGVGLCVPVSHAWRG
jgi:hypothetical protein